MRDRGERRRGGRGGGGPRRQPRRAAVAAALLCLAFCAVPAAALGHPRRARSHAGHGVYMANARLASAAVSRPRTYLVSGDGGFRIGRISWRRYGGAVAVASGTAKVDSCKPDCAHGKVVKYSLELRASRARKVAGRRFYTRLLLVYVGHHPHGPGRRRLDIAPLSEGPPAIRRLAQALSSAQTQASREQALLAALHTLGIGVYTGAGGQVEAGLESGPRGIYLYDFEVQALAGQLERGELASFDQLAAALTVAGVKLGGEQPTGALLAAATTHGIAKLHGRASTPEAALGLMVRDLGLARKVDLAKPQSPSAPILDAVQRLLLTIDLARADAGGGATASSALGPAPAEASAMARASDSCSSSGSSFYGAASDGALGASILIGKGITPKQIITKEVADGVHGVALAYSFHFVAVNGSLTGAFGSQGPQSAAPMQFQVEASMLDDVSHANVSCGQLANQKPSVAGIPVSWDPDSVGHLEYLGTIHCEAGCEETNQDGIATLTFQPDDEYLPGVGPKIYEHGTVAANAHPQKAAGNILGAIAEALGFTKEADIGYEVSYHNPGGYRVEVPSFSETWIINEGEEDQEPLTATYSFEDEEVCVRGNHAEHPLKPREAQLGASGSTGKTVATDSAGTFTASGGPAPIPIDFQPVAPKDYRNGQEDGGPQIAGLWVFDSPTLAASITSTPSPFVIAGPPSPPSQSFRIPVTQAKSCGNGLG